MSDFYKCEHGSTLCGTCVRALKTQNTALEKERDALLEQNKALKEETLGLNGRISQLVEERDRYKEGLENIRDGGVSLREALIIVNATLAPEKK